jgi:hypothetical protein
MSVCEYCTKQFATIYTLKTHQKTSKSCIRVREQNGVNIADKKTYDCVYCNKSFTTNRHLLRHTDMCNTKPIIEKLKEETKLMIQSELTIKELQLNELRKQMEEHTHTLEIHTKQIKEKSTPTIINTTIHSNVHNHMTIFTSMTPERVIDTFSKYYTIDMLMGGQKALADFVIDRFVVGEGGMIYLCVDRSRKKVCYTTDFMNFKEDINCDTLLAQLTPAYPIIKEKVDWSEYEKKYNPFVTKIHESFDEILAIRTDGVAFRSQLCRRLPSTMDDKIQMDLQYQPLHTLDNIREKEETNFVERKQDIEQIVTPPEPIYKEPVENTIHGIRLGKLDGCRKLFKTQGIYKIHADLIDVVPSDPDITQAYDDYIKRGTYKGIVIWD